MILEAVDICKTFYKGNSQIKVLKNLNFEISPGEIKVLLGHSGSGKSTLLNILGTLDAEYSGKLYIDGIDMSTIRFFRC